jgi:hypothetical protein
MARGSVTKRGIAWRIAVELPPDPISGKRRQLFETFHDIKSEADKRLNSLQSQTDQKKLGAHSKMQLREFLELWLRDYASTKAPKTCSRYRQLIEGQILPHLGAVPPDKLETTHLLRLHRTLRNAPRRTGAPGRSLPAPSPPCTGCCTRPSHARSNGP